jgi:hypothetical protein
MKILCAWISWNYEVQQLYEFEFIGQFFFQNDVFELQQDFSELDTSVFLENKLGSFQAFLILQIWYKPEANKIPKTVLKTNLQTKETTYNLVFAKYLVVCFWTHLIRAFSVFLEDLLRIISGTWRVGKILKNRFGLSTPKLSKNRWFYSKDKKNHSC